LLSNLSFWALTLDCLPGTASSLKGQEYSVFSFDAQCVLGVFVTLCPYPNHICLVISPAHNSSQICTFGDQA